MGQTGALIGKAGRVSFQFAVAEQYFGKRLLYGKTSANMPRVQQEVCPPADGICPACGRQSRDKEYMGVSDVNGLFYQAYDLKEIGRVDEAFASTTTSQRDWLVPKTAIRLDTTA